MTYLHTAVVALDRCMQDGLYMVQKGKCFPFQLLN